MNPITTLPFDDGGNNLQVNTVYAANEARFTAAHFSEPLTAYTVGWKSPDLQELLQFLAPEVPVGRRFEYKAATNREHFLTETDDVRAIGASFKRVEFTGTTVNDKTYNKGLTIRVDHDEETGDDWRERYTSYLLNRLTRNEIMRAISVLTAAATNLDKTWSSGTPDPDGDLLTSLELGGDAMGVNPNRIAFGSAPWITRASYYRITDTPYAGQASTWTPEELGQWLGVDRLEKVSTRYQATKTTKSKALGIILMFTADDSIMKDDPSNIKRFITPTDAGRFKVYVEEHAKFTDISVEHYSNISATSTLGVRSLTIS